ncbi:hypothetical protein [Arenibacterium halophilum]|jgi:hypothetical protein|uniref:Uncharacterized protein n=1 Tax=Arenibacterium halophilum TaxID=2583821 RepID=A0ABY2XF02_9RHOB|nr:hypothetical protein [Arenibacterium halophilum]MAY86842.1 hypothetical protein [Pseudooceanicola sp.]TMV15042.1 hypothetical protein FGK64_03480 [Arenibacterium halophilum]|tara:strand:+ start:2178 stop:2393 length:216 start_codon:yes stop_codon:yes gene_type:complete
MTEHDLSLTARQLEARIIAGNLRLRLELQPQLSRVLERLSRDGAHVPARLRNLNAVLLDEAIEHRFDNMPV